MAQVSLSGMAAPTSFNRVTSTPDPIIDWPGCSSQVTMLEETPLVANSPGPTQILLPAGARRKIVSKSSRSRTTVMVVPGAVGEDGCPSQLQSQLEYLSVLS